MFIIREKNVDKCITSEAFWKIPSIFTAVSWQAAVNIQNAVVKSVLLAYLLVALLTKLPEIGYCSRPNTSCKGRVIVHSSVRSMMHIKSGVTIPN